jgi:hypothetical protein
MLPISFLPKVPRAVENWLFEPLSAQAVAA